MRNENVFLKNQRANPVILLPLSPRILYRLGQVRYNLTDYKT